MTYSIIRKGSGEYLVRRRRGPFSSMAWEASSLQEAISIMEEKISEYLRDSSYETITTLEVTPFWDKKA